jgi:hypothetical protein
VAGRRPGHSRWRVLMLRIFLAEGRTARWTVGTTERHFASLHVPSLGVRGGRRVDTGAEARVLMFPVLLSPRRTGPGGRESFSDLDSAKLTDLRPKETPDPFHPGSAVPSDAAGFPDQPPIDRQKRPRDNSYLRYSVSPGGRRQAAGNRIPARAQGGGAASRRSGRSPNLRACYFRRVV